MSGDHSTPSNSSAFDIRAFLAAASHEIANPLNSISMNAGLAKMLLERSEIPRASEAIDRVLAECGRCASILREIERFGSKLNTQTRENVNIRALIDAAMTEFSLRYSGVRPSITIEADAHSIVVAWLPLTRALCALWLNAAEAGATNIAIRAQSYVNATEIETVDDGCGIPPEVLSRVTEPFFTTRRSSGHHGLGLSLADIVVREHGGHLEIKSNNEGRTRLVIRLPHPMAGDLANDA